jgi:hypothetical protein
VTAKAKTIPATFLVKFRLDMMVSIFHSAAPEQSVWIKNPVVLAIGTAIALAAQASNPPANTWSGSLSL